MLVEMYELADTTFLSELYAARSRHVTVEVLLDKDYDAGSVNAPAHAALVAHHVAVRWTNPGEIYHEKAVVVGRDRLHRDREPHVEVLRDDAGLLDRRHPARRRRRRWPRRSTPTGRAARRRSGPRGVDLVWSPDAEPTLLAAIAHAQPHDRARDRGALGRLRAQRPRRRRPPPRRGPCDDVLQRRVALGLQPAASQRARTSTSTTASTPSTSTRRRSASTARAAPT